MRFDDIRKAAEDYLALGWAPIPIPPRSKAPNLPGWQSLKVKLEEIPELFKPESNVGLVLGERGGNLIDVDLDAPEALAVARTYLPTTGRIHGRKGKPSSHWWYTSEILPPYEKFSDIDGTCLVEIRSTGHQTIVPPSVHPSGEVLEWDFTGNPAPVDPMELREAVTKIASCALVARHWPEMGRRNDAALALGGLLLRAGWEEQEAAIFIVEAAQAAGDEEWQDRGKSVAATEKKLQGGKPTTGGPVFAEIFGETVLTKLNDWLGIRSTHSSVLQLQQKPDWPQPLRAEAFHGSAGEIVRAIEPHTEADPVSLLIQLLLAFGNVIGPKPHFRVGPQKHSLNLFAVLVGKTAKARKGTSWSYTKQIISSLDPAWAADRIKTGLSTGEGLIHAVRNPETKREPIKDRGGRITGYQVVESDPGEKDKRLLAIEEEFVSPLTLMRREGNILSPIVRQAWDDGNLGMITKTTPSKATNAHISIIGHITVFELRGHLDTVAMHNGFANRFLWFAVRRTKLLPEGGNFHSKDKMKFIRKLLEALKFSKNVEGMVRNEEARRLWRQIYEDLSKEGEGIVDGIISRAEPQVMRLACLYALLDLSREIRPEHLQAALAVWEYSRDSVQYIFGHSTGNSAADKILEDLRKTEAGLTRTEIRDLFGRNRNTPRINRALNLLRDAGLAYMKKEETKGRPVERWHASPSPATKATEGTEG